MMKLPPIVSIVGRSQSGKTTLLEKLIPELKRRGYRVGTVKHHAHPGFEIDQPGKDSWRHAQAGSDHVVIVAPDQIASMRKIPSPLSLEEIASGMTDVDIILTDGFKRARTPKIEVLRSANSREAICEPNELVAVAADFDPQLGVPRFSIDEAAPLAEWIEGQFLKP